MKENVINKTENLIREAIGTNRKRKIVEVFDEVRFENEMQKHFYVRVILMIEILVVRLTL